MVSALDDIGPKIKAKIDSYDSIPKKLKRLASDRYLPNRRGLSPELVAQNVALNESLDKLVCSCDRSDANFAAHAEKACKGAEMGEFLVGRSAALEDAALLVQDYVQFTVKKVGLADLALAELRDIPDRLEREAEDIVLSVKASLQEIGCGVAAQPAFPYGNIDAAEHQLDHLARNVNVRSQAALAAVADARAEHTGACQTASEARQELEDAKKLLLEVARKALAG